MVLAVDSRRAHDAVLYGRAACCRDSALLQVPVSQAALDAARHAWGLLGVLLLPILIAYRTSTGGTALLAQCPQSDQVLLLIIFIVCCRVPLPTWGLVLMLLPATTLLLAILVIPLWERNFTMIAITTAAMVAGFVLYPLMQLAKERRWVHFTDLEFDYEHETGGRGLTYTITATGGLNYDPTYNAEYVDVVHDGMHRTTGSSMDLGSISFAGSVRGPGSATGSMGRSPRSPLGVAPPGALDEGPTFKVGSAPAAPIAAVGAGPAAAAAGSGGAGGGRNGGSSCSRLRPEGLVDGGGFHASNGAPPAADQRRLAAGQQLSSFKVRVSHETSFSDSNEDGPVSPSDELPEASAAVPHAGDGAQALSASSSSSGGTAGSSSNGSSVQQGQGTSGTAAGSPDLIKFQ